MVIIIIKLSLFFLIINFKTCGFRSTRRDIFSSGNKDYRMLGACYWFHIDDNSTQKLIPLKNRGKLLIKIN